MEAIHINFLYFVNVILFKYCIYNIFTNIYIFLSTQKITEWADLKFYFKIKIAAIWLSRGYDDMKLKKMEICLLLL